MADEGAVRERLASAVEKARQVIEDVREGRIPPLGEQNTKSALIGPVLTALGWDLTNPGEVFHEYSKQPQDPRVDYALFVQGKPRVVLEAKDLHKDLSDRKWASQICQYANLLGVEWCLLTNGDEYRLYNTHATVEWEQKLFRAVRVSEPMDLPRTLDTLELLTKDHVAENRLRALWHADFTDRRVGQAVRHLFASQDPSLIRWLRKRVGDLPPAAIKESLGRAEVHLEFQDGAAASRSQIVPVEPSEQEKHAGAPGVTAARQEGTGDWGVRAFRGPLQIEGRTNVLLLAKWRPLRREVVTQRVSIETVRRAAESACVLVQRGEEVSSQAIRREPTGPKSLGSALRGLAALLLAEAVTFVRASARAEYFAVPSGLTPEAMVAKVQQAAQRVEPSRQTASPQPAEAGRYALRRRFWTQLLGRAADKTDLHARITPGKENWLGTGAGRGGLSLCYVVREHDAHVELYIDRGKDAGRWNTSVFQQLRSSRESVEATFGHPLEWQPLEGKRACRIRSVTGAGGYRDESSWPEIHEAMIDAMVRLERALRPHILELSV